MTRLNCDRVDELAGAYALGAVDGAEEREVAQHLESCPEEHAETRELLAIADRLPDALEPQALSPQLRSRILETVSITPQAHRAAVEQAEQSDGQWWSSWLTPRVSGALAAAAVVVALLVGVRAVQLDAELTAREEMLRAVAAAEATYPVSGAAGQGWLLDTPEGPVFVAADLQAPPADHLYELWLLDAEGNPIPVGTFTAAGTGEVSIVPLERELTDQAAFAVTVERERVDAPTSEPVLIGVIEG